MPEAKVVIGDAFRHLNLWALLYTSDGPYAYLCMHPLRNQDELMHGIQPSTIRRGRGGEGVGGEGNYGGEGPLVVCNEW